MTIANPDQERLATLLDQDNNAELTLVVLQKEVSPDVMKPWFDAGVKEATCTAMAVFHRCEEGSRIKTASILADTCTEHDDRQTRIEAQEAALRDIPSVLEMVELLLEAEDFWIAGDGAVLIQRLAMRSDAFREAVIGSPVLVSKLVFFLRGDCGYRGPRAIDALAQLFVAPQHQRRLLESYPELVPSLIGAFMTKEHPGECALLLATLGAQNREVRELVLSHPEILQAFEIEAHTGHYPHDRENAAYALQVFTGQAA
jgi:hypothetical protein